MAKFSFSGFEEIERKLKQMGECYDAGVQRIVMAGAEVLKEAIQKASPIRTGKLKASVKISKPKYDMLRGWYVEVFPTGTAPNGKKRKRMEEVGFVQEYGRSNMPAKPWMRPAVNDAEAAAKAAMQREFEKVMGE